MIVVKVELWPLGDASKARSLGTMEIFNDGTGNKDTGNYGVRIYQWGEKRKLWKSGSFAGFARLRLGPWDLLLRALWATVGKRNARDIEEGVDL